ncbi:ribosome maturation factor RimP [Spiroplasma corruscae]|uniref:Ribosome maturation factor RimP n=1 Tax=Spiroplasma corruscae TaxID=216934 RepID=A0A222ENM8_9MOLU|nr:hypothetical protein [Spiroplasma corruscae]ASP28041.1 ribosome maturation factor RimP [Spiroplasma corruscae]
MNLKNIIEEKKQEVINILHKCNLSLYEINFTKEFDSNVIQFLVENIDISILNIDFDNLIKANESISEWLDEIDNTNEKYLLEVSSAGAERQIKNEEVLKNCINRYVYIILKEEVEGFKEFNAVLSEINNYYVFTINLKGRMKKIKLKWEQIKLIRFAIKF